MDYIPDTLKRTTLQIPMVLAGLLVPLAAFYFLYITGFGAIFIEDLLTHVMLVCIIVGFSFFTARYYYRLYVEHPMSPLLFLSLSTLVFGVIFMVHGVALTHSDLLSGGERFFDITEHYSLFLSALLFIGAALPLQEEKGFLYKNRKRIYLAVVAPLLAGMAAVFFSESVTKVLYDAIGYIVVCTGIICIALALFLSHRFSKTHDFLLLYFILGFTIIASSGYIPLFYSEGDLIWWLSHLTFPMGYTAIFVGLINYEREDLDFNLFFGEIPFYKKIGTKLTLTIFAIGLSPLLLFGSLMLVSVHDALNPILLFRFVLTISLLFILSTFFSFYFASKLILPLKKLRETASSITKGGEGIQVEIKTGDELEILADAFNEMSCELKRLHGGMEKTIREQTADISEKLSSLEETKKAMFNLLEDSKILEEKLAEEKAGVEQKVIQRTRELKEEKAKLLASIESLSFGFIIADTDDNVIVKNPAISTILELTKEPTSIHDIVESFKGISSGLDVLVHSCRECIDLKKVVELKEVSHGKKYLRVFCTPIITRDETAQGQEQTIGYVMLVEDITEAKIMERSRDEFFAVASHELRTPLTAIRGNADMILEMYADKIVDKDMKEMLHDIDVSSIRLISIVNDFLEVSRLEQGKIDIKKENFNASDIAEKVVRDLRAMIEQKGLSLTYTPPSPPLPMVFADKNKTEQILINLVGNATKFTKEGSITITTTREGNFVGVRVIDTGLGISEQNQTLLFRKFQQAGEQMLARDVTQSTGLGLYISKLIISGMGGTIGLEKSELGKGSTFVFTLPIAT